MSQHKIIRAVCFFLIGLLATASVINIHARSLEVHSVGGWHIWNISVGFAVFFALTVYAAMVAKRPRTKWLLAPVAGFAFTVTAMIQTTLYLNHGAGWITALAFGIGVPAAEGFLAMIDALMLEDEGEEEEAKPKRKSGGSFFDKFGEAAGARLISAIEEKGGGSKEGKRNGSGREEEVYGREVGEKSREEEEGPGEGEEKAPTPGSLGSEEAGGRREVLLRLLQEGPKRTGELEEALGVSGHTVRADIRSLNGHIDRLGRGVWGLKPGD